ncbi:crossover junction endodeoxyribonuclease RuvC [Candidatus Peregrinibacteria bacterium RIFCSPLOWO2_02_FULL_48_14]|nr:MAG: crossover junction endodeoxyribonuclease RuvC [Candidatus Peregrinibacteria bacterium RIFCSPLOWO2_02_FULL_48_14]
MRILGIDPGLATTGFAVLEVQNGTKKLLTTGVIRTAKNLNLSERLKEIYKDIQAIIKEYKPNTCAIEQIFFSKNITTGIQVSHARGVVLLALEQASVPYQEFSPSAMKRLLTGNGKADKKSIQKMLCLELGLKSVPKPDDAADALSLALCLSSTLR